MSKPYNRQDHLYRKAKEEGYRSRAAYKLLELDKKYRLFRKGDTVLDLGSYPGGWLQVALEKVGPKGRVLGIDLRELEPIEIGGARAEILLGDLLEESVRAELSARVGGSLDVLLSDMSPQLTGIRFADVARSVELVELAFGFAEELLRSGGSFVAKLFPGNESEELVRRLKPRFKNLSRLSLDSSRASSSEFYLIGRGFSK